MQFWIIKIYESCLHQICINIAWTLQWLCNDSAKIFCLQQFLQQSLQISSIVTSISATIVADHINYRSIPDQLCMNCHTFTVEFWMKLLKIIKIACICINSATTLHQHVQFVIALAMILHENAHFVTASPLELV